MQMVGVLTILLAFPLLWQCEGRRFNIAPDEEDDVYDIEYLKRAEKGIVDDQAISFCTGICMYSYQKPYARCNEVCRWNGIGKNPWNAIAEK